MEENLRTCIEEFFDDNENEKVIFIGAGFSKNLGLPTWEEFAYIHLDILKDGGKIDFETYELLKKDNFRTIISMSKDIIFNDNELKNILFKKYEDLFKINYKNDKFESDNLKLLNLSDDKFDYFSEIRNKFKRLERVENKEDIFSLVYDLNLINVTTNYDDILDILAYEHVKKFSETDNISFENKDKKVFYSEDDFKVINSDTSLIKAGGVYHIHGSINDINTMIVSNEDYIKRYWSGENPFKEFIKKIFDQYNVIFLGYSLQELEILNYLFEGEKGIIQKTNKKRIMLLDHFDYEKSKLNFLRDYYYNNYSIKLCPYSKSEKGFKILVDIIKKVSNIKNEVEKKKIGYKRCLELIEKNSLEEEEKIELLDKLNLYKDLQADFFKRINGNNKYLNYISQNNYFDLETTNIEALIRYMNSVYLYADKKDINKFYNLIVKNIKKNRYILNSDFILFILRYRNQIDNFKLEKLLNVINDEDFNSRLLYFLISYFNEEYIFEFFEENYKVIFNLIIKNILDDSSITYSISENARLLDYLLSHKDFNFIYKIINLYERSYIKNKYEDENLKVSLLEERLLIKSKNNSFKSFDIKFDNLKNIYDEIDKRSLSFSDSIKKSIRNLLNESSYVSVFNDRYLMSNYKIRLLFNISKLETHKTNLIDCLFESKVYYLKKISLYLIVKNNMVEYLIEKINSNNFDLEYMIRNDEFAGEIKECFELLNNYTEKFNIKDKNILNMIKKGEYFVYEYEDKDKENKNKIIWKYKRIRLLTKFKNINCEFENLKDKVDYDYELEPIIKVESGMVKKIPLIDSKKAIKMNIIDWVKYINNYEEVNNKDFLVKYSIEEDVQVFIECLKANLDLYMINIRQLYDVNNYEWLYYIFRSIQKFIEDNNDLSQYYDEMLNLIKDYIEKINDIYDEENINSISKKNVVGKICEVLTTILKKIDVYRFESIYKEIIAKLEEIISNKDDFRIIFAGGNDNYTSFINSIHQKIIELESIFSLKLKELTNNKDYIHNLLVRRMNNSRKEFLIFLGQYTWTFLHIDKELVIDVIKNINSDIEKEMFLTGFAYNTVINENQYNLVKKIILHLCKNKLKDKSVLSNIVAYDVLAFLLGYKNANLELIQHKHNLTRESIFQLFGLKETCRNLNNYNEEEYENKIITIWNNILDLKWDETEFDIIEATIEATSNFEKINENIANNIKKILEIIPESGSITFKVCEYLKRMVNLENIDCIIQIMKSYRASYGDMYMIKLCDIVKNLSEEKFNEFKEFWLLENKEQSKLRNYLI
ncbi:MAG: SIR2 family protein [Clostridium perfringens]|nr:SIR2 family protein [Clostridium perfringens]